MMLIKNPAGANQVLDFLLDIRDEFSLAVCLNDRDADGTDVSWIWDADFEKLAAVGRRLRRVIVSGDRAEDLRVRLKYAGVPEAKTGLETDYEKLTDWMEKQETPVFIMSPAVVFQANFPQGSGTYLHLRDKILGSTYLCLSSHPKLYTA